MKNADNYGWEPRRVLDQLTDIYLHLDSDVFAQALAADERSFRFELFEEAAVRLERALIKAPIQVVTELCQIFISRFTFLVFFSCRLLIGGNCLPKRNGLSFKIKNESWTLVMLRKNSEIH